MLLGKLIQLASFFAETSPVLSILGIFDFLLNFAIEGWGDFICPRLSRVLYKRIDIIDRFENGWLVLSEHIVLHFHCLPRVCGTDVIRWFSLACHTISEQVVFVNLLLLEQRFPLLTHGTDGLTSAIFDFSLLIFGAAWLLGASHCLLICWISKNNTIMEMDFNYFILCLS